MTVTRPVPTAFRPLGVQPPRRRFIAPAAVRLAQVCLVARITSFAGLVLTAGINAPSSSLTLPGWHTVTLPGGALLNTLAGWVLAGSVFEAAMVLRLGTLRSGSRRLVLLVEAVVIAATGVYAAAGFKVALVPMVAAIAAIVLLRLDHVRHSFQRAHAERRLIGRDISSVVFDGYAFSDPGASKPAQEVGYRRDVDYPRRDDGDPEMSRA